MVCMVTDKLGRTRIIKRRDKMTKHQCRWRDIEFGTEPQIDSDCVSFMVKCKVCGKEYEEVYTKNEGLWDVEAEEYVYPHY